MKSKGYSLANWVIYKLWEISTKITLKWLKYWNVFNNKMLHKKTFSARIYLTSIFIHTMSRLSHLWRNIHYQIKSCLLANWVIYKYGKLILNIRFKYWNVLNIEMLHKKTFPTRICIWRQFSAFTKLIGSYL